MKNAQITTLVPVVLFSILFGRVDDVGAQTMSRCLGIRIDAFLDFPVPDEDALRELRAYDQQLCAILALPSVTAQARRFAYDGMEGWVAYAPIDKMRHKFQYLSTFAKHSPTIELVGFFITVTAVRHRRDNETPDDRQRFARQEVLDLTSQLCQDSHNVSMTFMLGVFRPNGLSLRAFKGTARLLEENIPYSVDAAGLR